ncbi:MAG: TIGR04282 family arsenosugar biosynthesis glycosyltransferase [Hyphomicrobiaceae bacterium]|nr:TIGR04282 family arsenosugar biosynthesis glycosyltransferase [Hyphomicrobiaceae bacterium]
MMVRAPRAGRVKTRLARDVGAISATAFYRQSSLTLAARLGRDPRWRFLLAVTPDSDVVSSAWPHRVPRLPQGRGDLGGRLQRLSATAPAGPLLVIGSDSPAIEPRHIARAFKALGRSDAVIGPAPDGGYWLIGLKRLPRLLRPFVNVRWSSADTLSDTLANLDGCRVELLEPLEDIDDATSLARSEGRHARRVPCR